MNKGFAILPVVFIVVAVLLGGVVGYAVYSLPGLTQNDAAAPAQVIANGNTNTGLLGGDSDEHGCIGSAGYSWCEAKQKCLRIWEEDCTTTTNTNTTTDPIADWETYMNTAFDYSLQYPTSWEAPSADAEIAEFGVGVRQPFWIKKVDTISETLVVPGSNMKIIIDGNEATQQKEGGESTYVVTYFSQMTGYLQVGYDESLSEGNDVLLSIDFDSTADWATYTNSDMGYRVRYPANWTITETNKTSEITTGQTVQYVTIANATDTYSLHLGVKSTSQSNIDIWYRTGIGAGDFEAGESVAMAGTSIQTTKLVYQGKTVEVFFNPADASPSQVVIGTHAVSAYLHNNSENSADILGSDEYSVAKDIVGTLEFTD
ncbi:MAG: hypothetical protein WCV86_02385 [Patescibacteria group bacterium]|jgi:hypothetical protein